MLQGNLMVTQLDRIEEAVRMLNHHITGNGNPSDGLLMRVDRIEQRGLIFVWVLATVSTVAIGLLVNKVFA